MPLADFFFKKNLPEEKKNRISNGVNCFASRHKDNSDVIIMEISNKRQTLDKNSAELKETRKYLTLAAILAIKSFDADIDYLAIDESNSFNGIDFIRVIPGIKLKSWGEETQKRNKKEPLYKMIERFENVYEEILDVTSLIGKDKFSTIRLPRKMHEPEKIPAAKFINSYAYKTEADEELYLNVSFYGPKPTQNQLEKVMRNAIFSAIQAEDSYNINVSATHKKSRARDNDETEENLYLIDKKNSEMLVKI